MPGPSQKCFPGDDKKLSGCKHGGWIRVHSRLGGSIRLAYIQVAINAAFYAWIKLLQNAFCKIFQSVLAIGRSNHLEGATATIPGRIRIE